MGFEVEEKEDVNKNDDRQATKPEEKTTGKPVAAKAPDPKLAATLADANGGSEFWFAIPIRAPQKSATTSDTK